MDAGSSHTEVFVYKWCADQVNNTGVVSEVEACASRPGIDDNGANTSITVKNLMPCIENTTKISQKDKMGSTPVYLGATAGMRILDVEQPEVSKLIFSAIENALWRYKDKSKRNIRVETVRIITGQEEGLFGWIATNYLLKVFPKIGSKSGVHNESVGMLDMGGASAQIAYELKGKHEFSDKEVIKTRLYGRDYVIRSESNLCFGGDEVLRRHRILQILKNKGSNRISDPCYNTGFEEKFHVKDLLTICTEPKSKEDKGTLIPENEFTFVGDYDDAKCTSLVEENVIPEKCEKVFERCAIVEKQSPPADMPFYAVSNYFYVTRALYMKDTISYSNFTKKSEEWCKKPYEEIKNSKDDKLKPEFATNFCFLLKFVDKTLTKLHLFNESSFANIHFTKKIEGDSLAWALGFMIHATNLIPPEVPSDPLVSSELLAVLIVFSLFLVVIGIFLVIKWKKSRQDHIVSSAKEQHALNPRN